MPPLRQPFLPPEALSDERTIAAVAAHAVELARAGHARRGLMLALQAHHQARGLESDAGELAALNAAAICHGIRGDHAAAAAAGIDAYELAQRLGDRRMRDDVLVTLCRAACALGVREEARAIVSDLVRAAESASDASLEIRSRVAFGVVLGELGEYECAERQFARGLALVRRHGGSSAARIAASLANLHCKRAAHWLAQGAPAQSDLAYVRTLAVAQGALAAALEEANPLVEIDALAILGKAHALQGDVAVAHAYFERSAARAREVHARGPLARILLDLGHAGLALAAVQAAREVLLEALDAALEFRPTARIAQCCRALADCDRAEGNELGERRWRERAETEEADYQRALARARRELQASFRRA